MREAFIAAGYKASVDTLRQIAIDALARHPARTEAANVVWAAVETDAALLRALFQHYRYTALDRLLTEAAATLQREAGRGQRLAANTGQKQAAPSQNSERAADDRVPGKAATPMPHASDDGGGQQNAADTGQCAYAPSVKPVAVTAHSRALPGGAAKGTAGMAAVGAVAAKSLLDTFKANGMPIGDLTSAEANAWADSHARDVRFVRLLTANLPPHLPIRTYRTGEEAARLYEQAKENGDV